MEGHSETKGRGRCFEAAIEEYFEKVRELVTVSSKHKSPFARFNNFNGK